MAGELQFTIGLEISQFLHNIGLSSQAIIGLEKVGEGLKATLEKTFGVFEQGAFLEHLHKRTGESVASLYMLQKGFEAAGLESSDVAPMLFQMEKALGGVNDMGQDTGAVFARLGLSVKDLKEKGGAKALQEILGAIGKLNQSSGAKAASGIFGRGEAGNAVQLSHSMGEFTEAMKRAETQAYVFEKMAQTFAAIERGLQRIKHVLDPLFTGVAVGIGPAIKKAFDWLNSIDLSKIGHSIAMFFRVIQEAFKEGVVYDLMTETFEAAVEFLGNMIFNLLGSGSFWSGIWDYMVGSFILQWAVMAKLFMNLGVILKASLTTAFQAVFEWIGKIPKVGKMLGLEGYTADKFSANYAAERENASGANKMIDGWLATGVGRMEGSRDKMAKAMAEAYANSGGPAQDRLAARIRGLQAKVHLDTDKKKDDAAGGTDVPMGGNYKPEFTSLEKIGFVMSGLGNADLASQTARNTERTAAAAERTAELLETSLGNQGTDWSVVAEVPSRP